MLTSRLRILIASITFYAIPALSFATPTKLGHPSIYLISNSCQTLHAVVSDSTPDDQGLSDVEILWDSLGIIGPPLVSFNVAYDGPEPDQSVYTFEMVTSFGIKVLDPLKPAYAAVFAVGHAGDTATREWHYTPPPMSLSLANLAFTATLVGASDTCTNFVLTNMGTSAIAISNVEAPVDNHFHVHPAFTSGSLGASQSLTVNVCYSPLDTTTSLDTVFIDAGCYRIPVPLRGAGLAPMIDAGDIEFNGVDTGSTACKSLTVWNRGTSALVINPGSANGVFHFQNASFPDAIPPGTFHTYDICFSPKQYGSFSEDITWQTNEPAAYLHGKKDVSHLIGIAAPGGLHWDRVTDFYDPAHGGADTLTFTVTNTASSSHKFDTILFGGKFDGDFFVTNHLAKGASVAAGNSFPVDIAFMPNLNTLTPTRTAMAYILSNGTPVDSLFLTGVIPQLDVSERRANFEIDIYPNPVTSGSLHVDVGNKRPISMTVLDMLGRMVWNESELSSGGVDIPVDRLQNGDYFLRLGLADRVVMRRFSVLH